MALQQGLQCRGGPLGTLGLRIPTTAPARPPPSLQRRAPALVCAVRGDGEETSTSGREGGAAAPRALRQRLQGAALGVMAASVLAFSPQLPAALAVDNAQVGVCVLRNCQAALAGCLGDALCLENLVCLQTCAGRPDETECQIKCGDRFEDKAVGVFNTCAVSEKKCVPQKVDEGRYPVPPDCALDTAFDLSKFQGRWYITAGLNPLFDTFPCQEHYFASPQPGVVYAEINWRIPLAGGDFNQRSTMQRFVQSSDNPAELLNHDNEYLHYQDDWYIIGSKPDEYVLVYYRGQNDAWKGYGGATVYTRSRTLDPALIPELTAKAAAAGLDFSKFELTDNSCPPKPEPRGLVAELSKDVVAAEQFASQEIGVLERDVEEAAGAVERTLVEPSLRSFGRGFTVLERDIEAGVGGVVKGLEQEEEAVAEEVQREAQQAQRLIRRFQMEAKMGKWVQLIPRPLREIIMPVM